jgi:hypothetical protein
VGDVETWLTSKIEAATLEVKQADTVSSGTTETATGSSVVTNAGSSASAIGFSYDSPESEDTN